MGCLLLQNHHMGIIEFFFLKCRELHSVFMITKSEQGLYFYPGLIESKPHYGLKKKKGIAEEKVIGWFSLTSKDLTHTHQTPTTSSKKAVIQRIQFIAAFSKYILYMYLQMHMQTAKSELAALILISLKLWKRDVPRLDGVLWLLTCVYTHYMCVCTVIMNSWLIAFLQWYVNVLTEL